MVSVMLYSCEKFCDCEECEKKEHKCPQPIMISTSVRLTILNKDNEDLLDSAIKGYFPFDNMKQYHLIKGNKVEVYHRSGPNRRGMVLEKKSPHYWLKVFVNRIELSDEEKRIATSYLQLNESITDTIKVKVDDCYSINKIWYNSKPCKLDEKGVITIRK